MSLEKILKEEVPEMELKRKNFVIRVLEKVEEKKYRIREVFIKNFFPSSPRSGKQTYIS